VRVQRDETGNPFSRVSLTVDPGQAGVSADALAAALSAGRPRILLRSLYSDQGILQMDVRRLDQGTLNLVCRRIADVLRSPPGGTGPPRPPADRAADAVLRWLAAPENVETV
jgi:hypothetical protein